MTRREEIIEYLSTTPASIKTLAIRFEVSLKDVEQDLAHIHKTLKNQQKQLLIRPAECVSCHYQFKGKMNETRVKEPKKCPECHSERINPQLFTVA